MYEYELQYVKITKNRMETLAFKYFSSDVLLEERDFSRSEKLDKNTTYAVFCERIKDC